MTRRFLFALFALCLAGEAQAQLKFTVSVIPTRTNETQVRILRTTPAKEVITEWGEWQPMQGWYLFVTHPNTTYPYSGNDFDTGDFVVCAGPDGAAGFGTITKNSSLIWNGFYWMWIYSYSMAFTESDMPMSWGAAFYLMGENT